ncbi:MAG: hypothetical protein V4687_15020 [Bacteroidota bacterium]
MEFITMRLLISLLLVANCALAQNSPLKVEIKIVDTLNKLQSSKEFNLIIAVRNTSDRSIYIPNALIMFEAQVRDSISFFKIHMEAYKLYLVRSGLHQGGQVAGMFDYPSLLAKKYSTIYERKKSFGDSIVTAAVDLKRQPSFNPLFLAQGEVFPLYHINLAPTLRLEDGDYMIMASFNSKMDPGLPEELSGYKKYVFNRIVAEPVFIRVKSTRNGRKITVTNSKKPKR